jgi:hypothetical protein
VPRKRVNKSKKVALPVLNPDAAGIDIGATEIYVAVPADRNPEPIRMFATFTQDLNELADWLQQCRIRTVAMESTGVYWIPLMQILETRGLEVYLVNAKHVKNVPGRRTDVSDCQWLQYLHSVGLFHASFRPARDCWRLVRGLDWLIISFRLTLSGTSHLEPLRRNETEPGGCRMAMLSAAHNVSNANEPGLEMKPMARRISVAQSFARGTKVAP